MADTKTKYPPVLPDRVLDYLPHLLVVFLTFLATPVLYPPIACVALCVKRTAIKTPRPGQPCVGDDALFRGVVEFVALRLIVSRI